jgi:Fe-S oxidoreductase
MGLIMFHARVASRMPRVANALARVPLVKRLGGIAPERRVPPFAPETFRAWFEKRGQVNPNGDPVVLFPDTFNDHLHPGTLRAATEVLDSTGFRVVLPDRPICCGRPLYDYGMLTLARRFWARNLRVLRPWIREGVPVVGIEPSCIAAFRDELTGLLPRDEDAKRLALQTLTLAEFLDRHAVDWRAPRLERRAVVHGHCHQEAVMGMDAERSLYDRLGLDFEVLDSGCCGLAGSFGFEREHYDVSTQIAEHRLLPMVRDTDAETLIVADGFSCKTQIEELTGRPTVHTAELVTMAMEPSPPRRRATPRADRPGIPAGS